MGALERESGFENVVLSFHEEQPTLYLRGGCLWSFGTRGNCLLEAHVGRFLTLFHTNDELKKGVFYLHKLS